MGVTVSSLAATVNHRAFSTR